MTGRIPLLLHPLSKFKDSQFDPVTYLNSPELALVRTNITRFYRGIFSSNSLSAGHREQ